jgi:hypothetical protein
VSPPPPPPPPRVAPLAATRRSSPPSPSPALTSLPHTHHAGRKRSAAEAGLLPAPQGEPAAKSARAAAAAAAAASAAPEAGAAAATAAAGGAAAADVKRLRLQETIEALERDKAALLSGACGVRAHRRRRGGSATGRRAR